MRCGCEVRLCSLADMVGGILGAKFIIRVYGNHSRILEGEEEIASARSCGSGVEHPDVETTQTLKKLGSLH